MFKIRPNVLADMYAAIEEIVYMNELNGVRAFVTLIDDRYQKPRIGGYMAAFRLLPSIRFSLRVARQKTFLLVRSSIAFGRWAPARPSTKRFVFGGVWSTVCGRFPGGLPPPRPPATMA